MIRSLIRKKGVFRRGNGIVVAAVVLLVTLSFLGTLGLQLVRKNVAERREKYHLDGTNNTIAVIEVDLHPDEGIEIDSATRERLCSLWSEYIHQLIKEEITLIEACAKELPIQSPSIGLYGVVLSWEPDHAEVYYHMQDECIKREGSLGVPQPVNNEDDGSWCEIVWAVYVATFTTNGEVVSAYQYLRIMEVSKLGDPYEHPDSLEDALHSSNYITVGNRSRVWVDVSGRCEDNSLTIPACGQRLNALLACMKDQCNLLVFPESEDVSLKRKLRECNGKFVQRMCLHLLRIPGSQDAVLADCRVHHRFELESRADGVRTTPTPIITHPVPPLSTP